MIEVALARYEDHPPDPAGADDADRGGHSAALIRRHWPAVRRYLRVLGTDAATAEDLAQDAFVIALEKGLEDRGVPTAAFLRRTARLLYLEHTRKRRTGQLENAEAVWAEQEPETAARRSALHDCLPLLTERVQQAIRLAYGERRSRDEIATALGMQPGGIKSLLRRARATLKECMERAIGTPEVSR